MLYMAWLKLGQWLEQKGEIARAVLAYRAGLAEIPDDPALQRALDAAHARLGAPAPADMTERKTTPPQA
ncbi:MAG: hypothetical protein QM537_02510 [Candidatus Symbiobacter sp.]|nr:hypothetical protein [Candidatus Symbiobacter sp.]